MSLFSFRTHQGPLLETAWIFTHCTFKQKMTDWQFNRIKKKKSILIFFPTLFECAPQAEKQKAAAVLDKVCLWRCAHQMSPPLDPMSPQIKPNPNKNPVQSQRRKGASMKHNLHSTILVMWLEKSKNNGCPLYKKELELKKTRQKGKIKNRRNTDPLHWKTRTT